MRVLKTLPETFIDGDYFLLPEREGKYCPKCAGYYFRKGERFMTLASLSGYRHDVEMPRCTRCGAILAEVNVRGLAVVLHGRLYGAAKALAERTGIPLPTIRSWMQGVKRPSAAARRVLEDLGAQLGVRVRF